MQSGHYHTYVFIQIYKYNLTYSRVHLDARPVSNTYKVDKTISPTINHFKYKIIQPSPPSISFLIVKSSIVHFSHSHILPTRKRQRHIV